MAEDVVTGCGLTVDMPATGSAFPGGHNPRVGFFRVAQLLVSDTGCTAPFAVVDVADIVEVDDAVEAMLELEFWRERVLRCPPFPNISELKGLLPLDVHPSLVVAGWKEEATAVIGGCRTG